MSHLIDCVVGFTFLVDSRALTFVPLTRYWQSIRAKMMWSREQQLVRQAVALVLDNFYRSPASENEDKYKDVGGSEVSEDKGDGEGNANNAGDNMEEEEEGGEEEGEEQEQEEEEEEEEEEVDARLYDGGFSALRPPEQNQDPIDNAIERAMRTAEGILRFEADDYFDGNMDVVRSCLRRLCSCCFACAQRVEDKSLDETEQPDFSSIRTVPPSTGT